MADLHKHGIWATDNDSKIVVLESHNAGSDYNSTFVRADKLDWQGKGLQAITFPQVTLPFVHGNGYQVPAGYEFVITLIEAQRPPSPDLYCIYTNTQDMGWHNVGGATAYGTDPKCLWGMDSTGYSHAGGYHSTVNAGMAKNTSHYHEVFLRVAAGRYINSRSGSQQGFHITGFERAI